MSNLDRLWTEKQREAAQAEGWELALVVDEGKPVSTAYFEIFDHGPQFENRTAAVKHVIARAQMRSVLHIAALSARSASRVQQPTPTRKR